MASSSKVIPWTPCHSENYGWLTYTWDADNFVANLHCHYCGEFVKVEYNPGVPKDLIEAKKLLSSPFLSPFERQFVFELTEVKKMSGTQVKVLRQILERVKHGRSGY